MATRVLILNRQLAFAVKIKQALEQTGLFDVHPFTKADAAFEFLRDHPQDVALVDFTLPGRSGAKVVQQLRSIQPDLAVIVSPRQPEVDVESLNLQGMIEAPFNARDVIPLLESATNQGTQPYTPQRPQTRLLTEDEPTVDQSRLTTYSLQDEIPERQKFGATRRFDDPVDVEPEPPAQTRNLSEPEVSQHSPAQTRKLEPPDLPEFGKTRTLPPEELGPPKIPSTRILDNPPPRPSRGGRTRKLDDDISLSEQFFATEQYSNTPSQPTAPPEISSLDAVLQSFGFEPPVEQEDTPAVPMQDSDAVRQFLATSNHSEGSDVFDDILESIDPDSPESAKKQTDEFRGLVRSLQGSETHTPLPGRQQQTMDFILSSGMDSVLREIEKTKTGPLAQAPSTLPEEKTKQTTFQKLAADEPPPPTLEENGTVSDLLVGISDRGFRNVLSLLRGDEIEETVSDEQGLGSQDMDEAFRDFFGNAGGTAERPPAPPAEEIAAPAPGFSFDDFPAEPAPDDEATVALVVLQTALDESQFPKGFSVNRLISDIEDRLAAHRLNIRPLPSWDMDTTSFRAIIDQAEIREPSFLPEQLPPGEFIPPDDQATRVSAAVGEWLEGYGSEPPVDYLEDTIPSDRIRLEAEKKSPLDERLTRVPDDELLDDFVEMEDFPEPPLEAAWVDDNPEPASSRNEPFALPDEETPEPVSQPAANFALDHLFDDLVPAAAENWEETDSDLAPAEETPMEEFFSGVADEIEEIPDTIEPSWVDLQPLPDVSREVPAVDAGWVDSSEDNWDIPQRPDQMPVTEVFDAAQDDFDLVQSPSYDDDRFAEQTYEPEESVVESSGWTPPEGIPAVPVEAEIPQQLSPEEAYIAQLALNLTQVSLELSSEGSILTRESDIVAFAGHLSQVDALELRDVIHNDWDVGGEGARLRFISLPSSGKDYMLYSIRTVNELVLSMIFAGTTPLRVIRQQGQRLIEALESIPESALEEAVPPAPQVDTHQPAAITPVQTAPPVILDDYAYVWLLRDPAQRLSDSVSHAISTGLTTQLNEQRWHIQALEVDESYVYLLAGVPGEAAPHEIIDDLQRRSAEIAATQDDTLMPANLWADSYLVLTPGREMSREEIQEFIDFQRMM